MNVLGLCAGIGGLELGLLGTHRPVCFVERDSYGAAVLAKRFTGVPIWDDVATFDGTRWEGCVDIITSGFPCQPWSVAGQRTGTADTRWLWDDISRIIGEVRPRYVFLENVPGLVSGGGLAEVLRSLAVLGFDAEWGVFSAAGSGAPHLRKRLFILAAHPDRGKLWEKPKPQPQRSQPAQPRNDGSAEPMANAPSNRPTKDWAREPVPHGWWTTEGTPKRCNG